MYICIKHYKYNHNTILLHSIPLPRPRQSHFLSSKAAEARASPPGLTLSLPRRETRKLCHPSGTARYMQYKVRAVEVVLQARQCSTKWRRYRGRVRGMLLVVDEDSCTGPMRVSTHTFTRVSTVVIATKQTQHSMCNTECVIVPAFCVSV